MRLMDILEEVQKLNAVEAEGEVLSEAKKKAMKAKKSKIANFAGRKANQAKAEKVAKILKARPGNIKWAGDIVDTRNAVVSAFMNNDPETVIDMMAKQDGYKTIEVLKALETAHRGYKKLEAKAGNKKKFIQTVFAYIDAEESKEEA